MCGERGRGVLPSTRVRPAQAQAALRRPPVAHRPRLHPPHPAAVRREVPMRLADVAAISVHKGWICSEAGAVVSRLSALVTAGTVRSDKQHPGKENA